MGGISSKSNWGIQTEVENYEIHNYIKHTHGTKDNDKDKDKCPTANELMRIKGSRIKGITVINSVNSDLLKVLHYSIRRMRSSLKVQLQQNLS